MTILLFAANWGFAASGWFYVTAALVVGFGVGFASGWENHVVWSKNKSRAGSIVQAWIDKGPWKHYDTYKTGPPAPAGSLPPPPVFQSSVGPLDPNHPWQKNLDKFNGPPSIPYEELEGMFLDQFLLRYFYSLMPAQPVMQTYGWDGPTSTGPWDAFERRNEWAKEMPLLFEQLTGYKLNDIQLNNAIAEWVRRVCKTTEATKV
jgi:hypothetical protein